MEYHTYQSLYTIIKEQYPTVKSTNNDNQTYNQILEFSKNPKLETIVSSIKTTINQEPAKENKADRENYVYLS